jgi:hypothetical protein
MEVRVAAVDHHVIALQKRDKRLQRRLDHRRWDHHPDSAGMFECFRETFERLRPDRAFLGQHINRFGMNIVNDALVTAASKAAYHVGPHPAQSDHAQFHKFLLRFSARI